MIARFAAVLTLTCAASACMVHVADDDVRHARDGTVTQCSVSCPADGHASVRCPGKETPTCGCTPTPAAACLAPARDEKL